MNTKIKKVAFIDFDGTLIKGQSQLFFALYMYKKGLLPLKYILRIVLFFILYKLGIVKDVKSVFESTVAFSSGLSIDRLRLLSFDFVDKYLSNRIYKSAISDLNNLRNKGYYIVILSSAIEPIISEVSRSINADDYICTRLRSSNGLYDGLVMGQIVYGEGKKKCLDEYIRKYNIKKEDTIAYADHSSDLSMLLSVGRGFVVNPSRKMRIVARRYGLTVLEFN